MINVFLWFLLFIFLLLLFKYIRKINLLKLNKGLLMPLFISLFIFLFVYNLNIAIKAATDGLSLFISSVFPTVFPFLVLCNLLVKYDGISLYSKFLYPLISKPLGLSKSSSFPIAASILCGYPLGAKYTTDIYSSKNISFKEYKKLLNIASNCGPIFILGTIGASMLGNIKYGYILLIANYASIYIIGFILNIKKSKHNPSLLVPKYTKEGFGKCLKYSMQNAIETTLAIGGFIILFSVIITIIKNNAYICIIFSKIEVFLCVPKNSIYSVFLGSIEITNGCSIIASSEMSIRLKLSLISFLCSFSGLSIIAQVSSVIKSNEISLIKYSLIKLMQGIISFFITVISSLIFIPSSTSEACISASSTLTPSSSLLLNIVPFILLIIIFIYPKLIQS